MGAISFFGFFGQAQGPASGASQSSPATSEAGADLTDVQEACGADPGAVCEWVFERTNNEFLADATDWLLDTPLRVVLIILGAWILGNILRRGVRHFARKLTEATASRQIKGRRGSGARKFLMGSEEESKRSLVRASTIASVLTSVTFAAIWGVAFLMVLGELNVNIGPLLAGAGIAGIAFGFGAQTIVKDFLSGLFLLMEDQFGVGDIIDAGPATGTVEKISLRTTTLRDVTGVVWHIPNGEIHRVANNSQLWARALLDIEVAYSSDLRFAEGVIQKVADEMWADPEWGGDEIIERPEVWGIQNLGADGVAIRLVVKTEPATQWAVQRELKLRIKEAFDKAGIEIPYPQRTVWIRNEGEHPPSKKPDPKEIPTAPVSRYLKDLEEPEDEETDLEAKEREERELAEREEENTQLIFGTRRQRREIKKKRRLARKMEKAREKAAIAGAVKRGGADGDADE